jgi:RHS repeat-associated protein
MLGQAGEMTDATTGLVNLRARWYSPAQGRFVSKDTWQGDYNNPITLAKWLYANANPVIYTDPSGKITKNESSEANQIVANLQSYGVMINVDWGEYKIFINPLENNGSGLQNISCGWNSGRWSLNELYIVQGAVQNMDKAMNDRMSNLIGEVSITKDTKACGRGCTRGNKIELIDNGLLPLVSPSSRNSLSNYYVVAKSSDINFDQWSVVHELGHVWDNKKFGFLHIQLVQWTNGGWGPGNDCKKSKALPGCNNYLYNYGDYPPKGSDGNFNAKEDFAESVAAYVFPIEAQKQVQKYQRGEYRQYLFYTDYTKTKRWAFINSLIVHGN